MSNPTDQDAATARPWAQYCNDNTIYGATGLFVAIVQSANKLADTAFIVKAVNNHDRLTADNAELIACLREIIKCHHDYDEGGGIIEAQELLARLDAAAGKDL